MTTSDRAHKEQQPTNGKVSKPDKPKQGACERLKDGSDVSDLLQCVRERETSLWRCLNVSWWRRWRHPLRYSWQHPVKIYHLQQIASHLHSILFYMDTKNDALAAEEPGETSLCLLLDQLENPCELTRDSAWELAGEFERKCIELGDDTYLYTLLKDQAEDNEGDDGSRVKRVPAIAKWNQCFPSKDLNALINAYKRDGGEFQDAPTREKARNCLRHLHEERSEEYRRDRAKIRLRARYLARLAPILVALLVLLCFSYINVNAQYSAALADLQLSPSAANSQPSTSPAGSQPAVPAPEIPWPFPLFLFLFIFSSGALGGILSRAYRLGRLSVGVEPASPAEEASLGIRSLLATGKSLFAQVAIGGTSAFVVYLILQVIFPEGINPESVDPFVVYGVIGFLSGYSEPFFTRVLNESGRQSASTLQ